MLIKKLILIIVCSTFFIFSSNSSNNKLFAANDPGTFIMNMTLNAIKNLTNSSVSSEEKEEKFGELFDNNFDIPSISRFVLGKYITPLRGKIGITFGNFFIRLLYKKN